MKERPIIFNAEMIRAILDGRKTQTRRVLKKQPLEILPMKVPNEWIGLMSREPNRGVVFKSKYGVPGDRLWVKETHWINQDEHLVCYRADNEMPEHVRACGEHWRPSIHMPRWASRILLEITDNRVERARDITIRDLIAEGAWDLPEDWDSGEALDYTAEGCSDPRPWSAWSRLWDSINAKRGYGLGVNPWVWVIAFKSVKGGAQ